jgi:hypothetical protein
MNPTIFVRLTIGVFGLLLVGCSPRVKSEDDLMSLVRRHCTRNESRVSPKPLPLSKLRWLANPDQSEQIDELTQKWTYQFGRGPVDLHVIVETGNSWRDEDPMVFIDFKRLSL